jgi:hypothetical protein
MQALRLKKVLTLPHSVPRYALHDFHLLRDLVICQLLLQRPPHVQRTPSLASFSSRAPCFSEDNYGGNLLAPGIGGETDDGYFVDLRAVGMLVKIDSCRGYLTERAFPALPPEH